MQKLSYAIRICGLLFKSEGFYTKEKLKTVSLLKIIFAVLLGK